jgi:hypothetical protein
MPLVSDEEVAWFLIGKREEALMELVDLTAKKGFETRYSFKWYSVERTIVDNLINKKLTGNLTEYQRSKPHIYFKDSE